MNIGNHFYSTRLLVILSALLIGACSSSGGGTSAPTAVASPDSGTTINAGSGSVVIRFNKSMDTASLVLGGSMGPESDGGIWSRTDADNDTLTIHPTDGWGTGNASLTIAATDTLGNALSPLNLSYRIPLLLNTFQPASIVIGQADFSGGLFNQGASLGANTLNRPSGAPSPGSLYLVDPSNQRILGYNTIPATNNANADFVIGQPDFTSNAFGVEADRFDRPQTAVTAEGKLIVADTANHRVLIWNSLPTANIPADVVLGQPDFTSNFPNQGIPAAANTFVFPIKIAVAGGRLLVSDDANHRVLIWNSIPTSNNTPADLVLGQADFNSTSSNRGGMPAANTLRAPRGIWSDGQRLVIADLGNHRVLIWNSMPTSNGVAADLVIGQPDFNSDTPGGTDQSMNSPFGVYSNGLQLFISDAGNHRILIFDDLPTINQPSADRVLGQDEFLNVTPNDDNQDGTPDNNPSARTLNFPPGVIAIGNRLFVPDVENNRVLVFEGN